MTDNMRGALLMVGAMAAFTFNDTAFKTLADDMPLSQAVFLRGCLVTLALGGMAVFRGLSFRLARGRDRMLVALRTLGEALAAYFFLTALFNMPLANAVAIMQALPLVVTLASAAVFHEALGWRRILAVIIGFGGVYLIVRPGADGFNAYSIFALAAVAAVTIRDLATRPLSPELPSLVVAFYGTAAITVGFGLVSTTVDWQPITPAGFAALTAAAVFVLTAYVLSVAVMRVGEVGAVAPFRYSALPFALILGYLVFGDWPDALALTGTAIVAATGIYTLWREHRLSRHGPHPPRR